MSSSAYLPHAPELQRQFRADGLWNDERLPDYIDKWARETPDNIAMFVPGGLSLTYRDTLAKSRRFANALLKLGLRKGDVIAIQLPSHPEFLIAYFGVVMMGGVLCTLHMPYRAGEMRPLMQFAEASAVICTPPGDKYDAPATMLGLVGEVPTLKHVIVAYGKTPKGCLSMEQLMDGAGEAPVSGSFSASDPCLLCFTSGTSASPKGVMRTSETIVGNGRIYSETIRLASADRVMIAPPFTHVFGLCCVANAVVNGAPIVLLPLYTPVDYVRTIAEGKPTVVFTAPAHVAAALKGGLLDGVDLSSIREVVIAGSVCPPEVAKALEDRMPNGRAGGLFGMTECVLVAQTPIDAGTEVRHYSVGRATRGIKARVASNDAVLPAGKEGELQLFGYSIMSGYLKNDAANRDAFTADGWFRTGDLATIDVDGNIAICGRVKDLINRGGIKINPTEIENLVDSHDKVMQSAIVPMPDDVYGEKACLFVVPRPGSSISLDEINAYLEHNGVAKMRWPERLELIEEMPMTPTRKIIKGALAEKLRHVS
ncbi:MAG: acyl--CoA ligase [Xanthobacteraceae bacterium]|nr:acyl--CoA ligase [Xanthobacteraceae bacterium]